MARTGKVRAAPILCCSTWRHLGGILHCSYGNCSTGREQNNPSPDTGIREVGQITPWQKLTGHRGWLQKEEFAPRYLNSQRVFLLDGKEVFPKLAMCWGFWFRGDIRPHLHSFSTMPMTRHSFDFYSQHSINKLINKQQRKTQPIVPRVITFLCKSLKETSEFGAGRACFSSHVPCSESSLPIRVISVCECEITVAVSMI